MKTILFLLFIGIGVKLYLDFVPREETPVEPVTSTQYTKTNKNQRSSNAKDTDNSEVIENRKGIKVIKEFDVISEEKILKEDKLKEQALFEQSKKELANKASSIKNQTPPRPLLDEKGEINHDPSDTPF